MTIEEKRKRQEEFFQNFFKMDVTDFENLEIIETEALLVMLDDIVQVLSLENSRDWGTNNNSPARKFRELKREIRRRLKEAEDIKNASEKSEEPEILIF